MSAIQITNIMCNKNQASFLKPIELTIYFEVFKEIKNEIDWKLVYIGCANDQQYDQTLEQFSMGPFSQQGPMQFSIQADAPDYKKIPTKNDILGVTAVILSASYKKQEFFRCGFYVYNCYGDQEIIDNDTLETPIQIDKVQRNILSDKPRITRFDIQWDVSIQESTQESGKQQGSKDNSFQQAKQNSEADNYQDLSPLIINAEQHNLSAQKEQIEQMFENSNGFDQMNNIFQFNSILNSF